MIGLIDGAHGVAWPSMRLTFGLPVGALALLTLPLTAGYVVSSSLTGWMANRWGTGGLLWRASAAGALGLVAVAVSPAFVLLLAGAVLLGAAGGAIDAGVQAQAAARHGLRMMGGLHAAYGIGAALSPLGIAAMLAAGGSWRLAYAVLAGAAAALAVVVIRMGAGFDRAEAREPSPAAPSSAFSRDMVRPVTAFFIVTALEAAAAVWLFTYLREGRLLSVAAAGAVASAFGLAYTLPRLALAVGGHRTGAVTALRLSLGAAVLGFTVLAVAPLGVGSIGLLVAGMGVGGVYPSLMALTSARVESHRLAAAVGYQVGAATAGAAAGVGLPALVFQTLGLSSYPMVMLLLAGLATLAAGARPGGRRPDPA